MIAVRTEDEIGVLRQANQIVAEILHTLMKRVQPGVRTKDLDAEAEMMILMSGAEPAFKGYHGYPACTCISVDHVVVHGIPGDQQLVSGKIVSIDVGVRYKGYYGDAAVSVACGDVDEARQRLMDTTERSLGLAIRAAKAGACIQDISRAVEQTCKKAGYGVVTDFVGHGIGAQMHEAPQVPNFDTGRPGPRLAAGMVLAIEPMINMGTHKVRVLEDGWTAITADRKPSAHFEHSIVVREDGGEILSRIDGAPVWGLLDE